MTKRTTKQWQRIMAAHAKFAGTTKQFCIEQNIHIQTFYSRRHAMCLSTPMSSKKCISKKQIATSSPIPQTGQFVQAQVSPMPSSILLQTQHAQLSLSTQCDPVWLATLLKGLAA
jgi:hypothetical protein